MDVISIIIIVFLVVLVIHGNRIYKKLSRREEGLLRKYQLNQMTYVILKSLDGKTRIFTPNGGQNWYVVDEKGKILGPAEELTPEVLKQLNFKIQVVDQCRIERELEGETDYIIDHGAWRFGDIGIALDL